MVSNFHVFSNGLLCEFLAFVVKFGTHVFFSCAIAHPGVATFKPVLPQQGVIFAALLESQLCKGSILTPSSVLDLQELRGDREKCPLGGDGLALAFPLYISKLTPSRPAAGTQRSSSKTIKTGAIVKTMAGW